MGGAHFGADAVSPEITEDTRYLEAIRSEFAGAGIPVEASLAYGEPVREIVRWVHERHCDLVAMSTHGHRLLGGHLSGHDRQPGAAQHRCAGAPNQGQVTPN